MEDFASLIGAIIFTAFAYLLIPAIVRLAHGPIAVNKTTALTICITNAAVILILCLAPCMAFLLFSLARKNAVALLAAGGFLLCHLTYGVINFIR